MRISRNLARLSRVIGIPLDHERDRGDADEVDTSGTVDHGAPDTALWHPTAWRGLTEEQIARRWEDLRTWVDWLITAYRLPPRPWEGWWECPGVCEELSALRAWHRALVDVPEAELRHPPEGLDVHDEIDWQRAERTARLEVARSHVEWHEALWQIVSRVAGVQAEMKPLLMREAETTERTTKLRADELALRTKGLAAWLARDSRPGAEAFAGTAAGTSTTT